MLKHLYNQSKKEEFTMFKMNKKILVLFAVSITIPGIYAEPAEKQPLLTKTVSGVDAEDDNNNNNSRLNAALKDGAKIVTSLFAGLVIGSRAVIEPAKHFMQNAIVDCSSSAKEQADKLYFHLLPLLAEKLDLDREPEKMTRYCQLKKHLEDNAVILSFYKLPLNRKTLEQLKNAFYPSEVSDTIFKNIEREKRHKLASFLVRINRYIDTGVTQFRGLNDSNKNMLIGSGALLLTGYIYKKVWQTNNDKKKEKA